MAAPIDKELKKQLLVEKAKEKLQKYKLTCTRLEAKKGLEPLNTADGKPVQNAITFSQWEKLVGRWRSYRRHLESAVAHLQNSIFANSQYPTTIKW